MIGEAHPDILDRDRAQAEAEEFIDRLSRSLCCLVNRGTTICAKILSLPRKDMDDHIVMLSFYRHILQMIDAIEVMVSQGVGTPCGMQLRSCFEHLLYMYHLGERDSKFRAKCYGYMQLRRALRDFQAYRELLSSKNEKFDVDWQIMTFEAMLEGDDLRIIHKEYLSLSERDRLHATWYSLFGGPKNIKQLAKHHNFEIAYENVYRTLSRITHGQAFLNMFIGGEVFGTLVTYNLRDISIFIRARDALLFGMDATAAIVSFSLPHESDTFADWYSNNIESDFSWLGQYRAAK